MAFIGRTHTAACGTVDCLEAPGMLRTNVGHNLFAQTALALMCARLEPKPHVTVMNTGCIYDYGGQSAGELAERAATLPPKSDTAEPDFFGSAYSTVKGFNDRLMRLVADLGIPLLNARIRMPVSDELHPRNLIIKAASYARLIDVPNSVTCLPELLPVLVRLALVEGHVGSVNLVNPGLVSPLRVARIYAEALAEVGAHQAAAAVASQPFDPKAPELSALLARRSNCHLSAELLVSLCSQPLATAEEAVRHCARQIASCIAAELPNQ
jgi:3,5-epimerase/4-reductase